MKLKFYKEEDNDYVKIITQDGNELEFDYIEMIRHIFNDKKLKKQILTINIQKKRRIL